MKQRDLELLSSYLDGLLNPSDSARLEARLLKEPELRSVLRHLRSTRSLLRQLPMRKAPRNFRLTPQMVGKNPPLPRAYPAFRFTSALATILLFITFGLNFLRPQMASPSPVFGMGGGGGSPEETFSVQSAPVTEAPAATEAPAVEAPALAMSPLPTVTTGQEDAARLMETPVANSGGTASGAESLPAPEPKQTTEQMPLISGVWQWLLAGIALVSAFIMAMMRQLSINRWRKKI